MTTTSMIPPTLSSLGHRMHGEAERRGVLPFLEYVDAAYAATMDIDTVVGLLRGDVKLRETHHNSAPVLSSCDTDNLFALVQFAVRSQHQSADSLRVRTDDALALEIDQ